MGLARSTYYDEPDGMAIEEAPGSSHASGRSVPHG